MRPRVTSIRRRSLLQDWEIACSPSESIESIEALDAAGAEWISVPRASTVAASLLAVQRWSIDDTPVRFDATDWWFRKNFHRGEFDGPVTLGFGGLATVCDVWLNGALVLSSRSMFIQHEVLVPELKDSNELVIRFHSLDKLLKQRRPRPRWRAPMIENQQLRWFRTTVLGRTPGWSPPAAPVGVWGDVWLEGPALLDRNVSVHSKLADGTGLVRTSFSASPELAESVAQVELVVERDSKIVGKSRLSYDVATHSFVGEATIDRPSLWWPHTHGDPALYGVRIAVHLGEGERFDIVVGNVGFRTINVATENGNFAVSVNGVPIFCRGACWTPLDTASLRGDMDQYSAALDLITRAGMNMLRVGGTMVYESDEFLDECDKRGILLWQEFMFANMDYPAEDSQFDELVRIEARQQLQRLQARPCLAILCGNSEVEQQAAMWGGARELWSPPLFHRTLSELSDELCPDVAYWPSSAHGGAFPHQPSNGTTSYYGVGAYLRPLDDARRSRVKFASECLAFANVAEDKDIASMPNGLALKVHHSQWKARTPRDLGAGWDFEDVRDHYLEQLFAVNARTLRYSDHERYLDLSRVVTGQVMASTFGEWRRTGSSCNGALVWFLKDLWHGAGWGVLDAAGQPKPAYYFLSRSLQSIGVTVTNEGCNGLAIHVVNDSPSDLDGTIDVALYQQGEVKVATARRDVAVEKHASSAFDFGALFDSFLDSSYAYRFGPPTHDLVVATLSRSGEVLAETCYLPLGLARPRDTALALSASVTQLNDMTARVAVRANRFAQAVLLDVPGWSCHDNYFDVRPGGVREIGLTPLQPGAALKGTVRALNGIAPAHIAHPAS